MNFEFPADATPIADISDLLVPWVQTMKDLNRVEAENISQAQSKYLRPSQQDVSTWFHIKELQNLHRSMFGFVWSWAGKQRKQVTSIGVLPGLISLRMAELCNEVGSWVNQPVELTFLEKSARIHHRLVFIHPFENGNGRFSRMIADRALLSWKCPHPTWPDQLHFDGIARKQYIGTLKAADKGDYEPLIALMKILGAADPTLPSLIQDKFYKPYLDGTKGLSKIKAFLRRGEDPNSISTTGHGNLQSVIRLKLDPVQKIDILKLLIDSGSITDVIDASGLKPLQLAVKLGEQEIAHFLSAKSAH